MAERLMPDYGPPIQYPPDIAQEYTTGLENAAKGFVQDIMRRDRAEMAAAQQRQAEGIPTEAAQHQ
jgi:transcription factor SPT20